MLTHGIDTGDRNRMTVLALHGHTGTDNNPMFNQE